MMPSIEKVEEFLKEYETLCRKHGLMILSEGEEVWVDEANENLWNVAGSTLERIYREGENE